MDTSQKPHQKIKSIYPSVSSFRGRNLYARRRIQFTTGHWWHSVKYLVSQQLTQSKLTHRDSREQIIFHTTFFCALWKNLLLQNFIAQLLSALKAKERRKSRNFMTSHRKKKKLPYFVLCDEKKTLHAKYSELPCIPVWNP